MSIEKIKDQISKLTSTNGDLALKIAVNKSRIRALVGKHVGVKVGDVVVSKGQRYRVGGLLSDAIPTRGKPALSGFKIAKNGNLGKRPVKIRAWSVEGPTIVPKQEIVRGSSKRSGGKILTKKPAKRGPGRASKKSLEDFTILGTA